MEDRWIYTDAIDDEQQLLVGALLFADAADRDRLLAALRTASEEVSGRDLCLAYVRAFMESPALFRCSSLPQERVYPAGRCREIYRGYQRTIATWLEPGTRCSISIEHGFESRPCKGSGCKFVYVGGSPCPSSKGRPVDPREAHLRTCDLYSTIERQMSPRSEIDLRRTHEDETWLIELVDLLCGLSVSLGPAHAATPAGHGSTETETSSEEPALIALRSASRDKVDLTRMWDPNRKRGVAPVRDKRRGGLKKTRIADPDAAPGEARI